MTLKKIFGPSLEVPGQLSNSVSWHNSVNHPGCPTRYNNPSRTIVHSMSHECSETSAAQMLWAFPSPPTLMTLSPASALASCTIHSCHVSNTQHQSVSLQPIHHPYNVQEPSCQARNSARRGRDFIHSHSSGWSKTRLCAVWFTDRTTRVRSAIRCQHYRC